MDQRVKGVNISFFNFLISSIATVCLLSTAQAYAEVTSKVSQVPLGVSATIAPNIIFTLDESGSMSWGYIPDKGDNFDRIIGSETSPRFRAANTNPMYYNPYVKYEIPPSYDENGDPVRLETKFTDAPINGFDPGRNRGNTNLSYNYRVIAEHRIPHGTFRYVSYRTSVDPSSGQVTKDRWGNIATESETAGPAYYFVYDPKLKNGCNAQENNDYCYRKVIVSANSGPGGTDERQNFANWYSFYRSRALATLSAASIAFDDMSSDIRLTWQNLATCIRFDGVDTRNCKQNALRPFDKKHKGQFYSWFRQMYFNVGTPLPAAMTRAGEYLKQPRLWEAYPGSKTGNTAENTYACRPTYHVMMTDGMWNTRTGARYYNENILSDDVAFELPDKKRFAGQRPFNDATQNTLADLAMHYWATDAQPRMANKVRPRISFKNSDAEAEYWDPRNNPASWQHMVNFIMGLGLTNMLSDPDIPWENGTFKGGYDDLKNGNKHWPVAGLKTNNWGQEINNSGRDENAYDLWHAAINSRGEFFSVDSPEDMVLAFRRILETIGGDIKSAAPPAVSSGVIEDDSSGNNQFERYYYNTQYDFASGWAGDLIRSKKTLKILANGKLEETVTKEWSAKELLNNLKPTDRNIKFSNQRNELADFIWSNAGNAAQRGTLAYYLNQEDLNTRPNESNRPDGKGEKRLNFLRGVRSAEGSEFRVREHVLGDIYSSQPITVAKARFLVSQANRIEPNSGYQRFANDQQKREGRIYVGANDGMLHAFDVKTGKETFAYVPKAVFSKLNQLTALDYNDRHMFYVDGSPVVSDVYDSDKKIWRTILVGTLRAGGKGIFALDITDPDNIELLWDKTDKDFESSTVKLGYSFSKPTIARMHHGRWSVVTGNGYESSDGSAGLLIIDALTGELTKALKVEGKSNVANGLSTPQLADNDADGIADYAYAGDLQGNLWRFDLLGDSASANRIGGSIYGDPKGSLNQYQVSFSGKPLFTTASIKQPITAAPTLVRHPSRVGYIVMFGTGKNFEILDNKVEPDNIQAIYGVWDKKTKVEITTASDASVTSAQLVKQTITEQVTGTRDEGGSREARLVSNNKVDWKSYRGWVLDLKVAGKAGQGERVVEKIAMLGQKTALVPSLVPNEDPCATGNSNWLYALDPASGGITQHHVFDTQYPKQGSSSIVSAISQEGEGGITISRKDESAFEACTGQECLTVYPDLQSLGRQSWRIVPRD